MASRSAGLLMFRRVPQLQVLLVHPGGPFWVKKDVGAWSIPKGEYVPPEDALVAAKREFQEETGFAVVAPLIELGTLKQPSGKLISAWAFESDCDPTTLVSNTFNLEWPPRSGQTQTFPEVDRAAWFDMPEAKTRILKGQAGFLDLLAKKLTSSD